MSLNSSAEPLPPALQNRYVLGKDKCEGLTRFLRIKIPNGKVSSSQFRALAALSRQYGRGYSEITDRQNLQLHWVDPERAQEIFTKLDGIGFSTDHGGQGIPTAGCGDVRAIVSCPAAGIDHDELIDTWPLAKQIDGFFNGNKDFLNLPRKLKIALSGCNLNCGSPEIHDLAFAAVKQPGGPGGEVGFAVLAGGTIATAPQLGRPLNVLAWPDEVLDIARCTAEIFRDFGSREAKARARFRWLVDAWGTEKLRGAIEEKMGKKLTPYPLADLPSCRGEHVGVVPQKQEGKSFINIPVVSGVLSSEKMLQIAQIAEQYGDGDLRLTPFQNIIVANVPDGSVDQALKSIGEAGYSLGGSHLRWATVACAGNFCGKTLDHPKNRAAQAVSYLESRFGGRLQDVKLRVSFSGCPNGCARHLTADIGLQGSAVNVEGKTATAYNLYVKDTDSAAALGKLIARGIKAEDAKFAVAGLIEAYLGSGAGSFTQFCQTKSTEELQAAAKPAADNA